MTSMHMKTKNYGMKSYAQKITTTLYQAIFKHSIVKVDPYA